MSDLGAQYRRFVEDLRTFADQLRSDLLAAVVAVGDAETPFAGVVAVADELAAQVRNSDVKVVLLGPLKAGKSTFMNVLTSNPNVSQVTPLPAYPCVVEVRRSAPGQGDLVRFRDNDGQIISTSADLAGAQHRLTQLLEIWMANPVRSEDDLDVAVVETMLEDGPRVDDVGVSLLDTPGLFFTRPVERGGGQAGEHYYSEITRRTVRDADVIVYVVRPEQLFLYVVAESLAFLLEKAETKRIFLVVNASRAHIVAGGHERVEDQVRKADEIWSMFRQHVFAGDHALGKAIVTGESDDAHRGIRGRVIDLLHVWQVELGAREAMSDDELVSYEHSRAGVQEIRSYIRDGRLLHDKRANLERQIDQTTHDVVHQTQLHVEAVAAQLRRLADHRRAVEVRLQEATASLDAALAALENEKLRRTRIDTWIVWTPNETAGADVVARPTAPPTADPVINAVDDLCTDARLSAHDPDAVLPELVAAIRTIVAEARRAASPSLGDLRARVRELVRGHPARQMWMRNLVTEMLDAAAARTQSLPAADGDVVTELLRPPLREALFAGCAEAATSTDVGGPEGAPTPLPVKYKGFFGEQISGGERAWRDGTLAPRLAKEKSRVAVEESMRAAILDSPWNARRLFGREHVSERVRSVMADVVVPRFHQVAHRNAGLSDARLVELQAVTDRASRERSHLQAELNLVDDRQQALLDRTQQWSKLLVQTAARWRTTTLRDLHAAADSLEAACTQSSGTGANN